MPTKDNAIEVILSAFNGAVDGAPPFSIRISPNNPGTIKLLNGGAKISDRVTARNVNPLVTAGGNLNWGLKTRSINELSKSQILEMRMLDFSDIFGLAKSAICKITPAFAGGGYLSALTFTNEIVDAINTRLAAVDLPLLGYDQPYIKTYTSVAGCAAEMKLLTASRSQYAQRIALSDYRATNATASLISESLPAWANSARFTHVVRILMPGITTTEWKAAGDTTALVNAGADKFWYLHYNIL